MAALRNKRQYTSSNFKQGQNLNKSYPSCFAPGVMIRNCLRGKGVSQNGTTLVEGFNTGIQIYKQTDSSTRAIIDAACMN
jgi:hypothetical protein